MRSIKKYDTELIPEFGDNVIVTYPDRYRGYNFIFITKYVDYDISGNVILGTVGQKRYFCFPISEVWFVSRMSDSDRIALEMSLRRR